MTNALTLLVFSACLGACAPGNPENPPPRFFRPPP